MANLGFLETKINALPKEIRAIVLDLFRSFIRDLRLGHPTDGEAMENFGGAFYDVTTHATPGSEFTIPHGFGRTPYLLLPVLPLDVQGAQIVPLTVSRIADDKRVYLKSSIASAPITVGLEG